MIATGLLLVRFCRWMASLGLLWGDGWAWLATRLQAFLDARRSTTKEH